MMLLPRPEERPLVRRLLDLAARVEQLYQPLRTDFLTPREQMVASSVIRNSDLTLTFWGGYPDAQRARAVICPPYVSAVPEDYGIGLLHVAVVLGNALHHGQLLGSVLGTGIDRRKLGDIALVSESTAHIALAADLVAYVWSNWRKAGRYDIELNELPQGAQWPEVVYTPRMISVSSMRLDAIVAAVCNWSRSKAQGHVEAGQVSVNFIAVEKPDAELAEADILSVRGFGRIRMGTILGETKRGRLRVEVGTIES